MFIRPQPAAFQLASLLLFRATLQCKTCSPGAHSPSHLSIVLKDAFCRHGVHAGAPMPQAVPHMPRLPSRLFPSQRMVCCDAIQGGSATRATLLICPANSVPCEPGIWHIDELDIRTKAQVWPATMKARYSMPCICPKV